MSASSQDPEHRFRVREVFDAVSDLPQDRRRAALDRLCGDQPTLRREIEEMLAAVDSPPPLLRDPGALARSALNERMVGGRTGDWIDGYELLDPLQQGSFGVVWRAREHRPLDRIVALKLLKVSVRDPLARERFAAEGQALARMSHPHIARVFSAGTTSRGQAYLAMELVDGQAITDACRELRLSFTERLELFEQVCRAAHSAHEQGVIHRDLKPDNVLVELHDDRPFARVIDFGIAHVLGDHPPPDTTLTDEGTLLGSLGYMSPEQFERPDAVDARADVYSLGAILFELIRERPLIRTSRFTGGSLQTYREWMQSFRLRPPRRPQGGVTKDVRRWARQAVEKVMARSLARSPDRRYPTARALADAVQAILERLRAEAISQPAARSRRRILLTVTGLCLGAAVTAPRWWKQTSTTRTADGASTAPDVPGEPAPARAPGTTAQSEPPPDLATPGPLGTEQIAPPPTRLPLMDVLRRSRWRYRDSRYPRGDEVTFRPIDERGGTFHDKWNWKFTVRDPFTLGIDFWGDGTQPDVWLEFDPNRVLGQGTFTDKKSHEHRITLRRLSRPAVASSWGGRWESTDEGHAVRQTSTARRFMPLVFGDPDWSHYDLTAETRILRGSHGCGLVFHVQDRKNYAAFSIGSYDNHAHDLSATVAGEFRRRSKDHYRRGSIETGKWYALRVEVRGPAVKCFLDGRLLFATDDSPFDHGRVGLKAWGSVVAYRALVVRAPTGEELFAGIPSLPE